MTDIVTQDIIKAKDEEITEQEATAEFWKNKHDRFISDVAKLIMSPEDEESVLKVLPKYVKSYEEAEEFKVKFEKEVQARKDDYLKHQEELEKIQGKLDTLGHQFAVDIQIIVDKYEARIQRLEKQLIEAQKQAEDKKTQVKTNSIYEFFRRIKL